MTRLYAAAVSLVSVVALATCAGLFAAACGGAAATAPGASGSAADEPSAPEAQVAMLEQLAGSVDAAAGDCERVADVLGTWLDTRGGQYRQLAATSAQTDVDAATLDGYERRVDAALLRILDSRARCEQHPRARARYLALDTLFESN